MNIHDYDVAGDGSDDELLHLRKPKPLVFTRAKEMRFYSMDFLATDEPSVLEVMIAKENEEIRKLDDHFEMPSFQRKREPLPGYYPWGRDRRRAFIRSLIRG